MIKSPISVLVAILLAGCTATDDTMAEVEAFDGIAADEVISLVGTEPFWGARIANSAMTYTTPENIDGTTFPVERFAGNGGLGFRGALSGAQVQVAVTPGTCSDGMSDRSFPYRATVTIGEQLLEGCAYTDRQPFSGPEAP